MSGKPPGSPSRRHESRAIAIFQTLLGKEVVKSEVVVPRVAHSIDVLLGVEEPADFWGPLGPLVAGRTLVLELESGAPSLRGLWTGLGKLAWTVTREWKDIAEQGRRYPMLLFLSADCPGWIRPGGAGPGGTELGGSHPDDPTEDPLRHGSGHVGFVPMTPRGTYALRFDMPADVVLVHLRGLPDEPGLSVLRLLVTPRNEKEMRAGFSRLLEDPAVLQSTKDALLEAFMQHRIPATETERWLSADALRAEGERQALLRMAQHFVEPDRLQELEAISDLAELERRVLTLVKTH